MLKRITVLAASLALFLGLTALPMFARQRRDGDGGRQPVIVVINQQDDTVDIFHATSGEKLGRVRTGTHPHEVALSLDGATAYVSLYGAGSFGNNPTPNNKLAVINVKAMTEETQIDLGEYLAPHGLAVDPRGRVWVTVEASLAVVAVDPKQRKIVAAVPTSTKAHWIVMLPDGSKAYTSNKDTSHISVIDTASRQVVKKIPVPRGVEGIALTPDGRRVYASDDREPVLHVIDTAADVVLTEVALKQVPGRVHVTPDNRFVLISSYRSSVVEIVEEAMLAWRRLVPVGNTPFGIACSLDSRLAYVANYGEGSISVIDMQTFQVVRSFATGKGPETVAYTVLR